MLRRSFLFGLGAALAAPAVVHSGIIMPISSLKLPKLQYISAIGDEAGTIMEVAGSPPEWMIPCDGRMVNGLAYPDLFKAVRARAVTNDDEWINVPFLGGHELNNVQTVDVFTSYSRSHVLSDEYGDPLPRSYDRLVSIMGNINDHA